MMYRWLTGSSAPFIKSQTAALQSQHKNHFLLCIICWNQTMDVHFAAHVLPVLTGMITPDRRICYSILSSHATAPDCKLYAVCYIIDACCVTWQNVLVSLLIWQCCSHSLKLFCNFTLKYILFFKKKLLWFWNTMFSAMELYYHWLVSLLHSILKLHIWEVQTFLLAFLQYPSEKTVSFICTLNSPQY